MYGRDPKKLTHARESIADLGRRARRSFNPTLSAVPRSAHLQQPQQQIDIDKEVKWLMLAWNNASAPARRRFLELINKDAKSA